MSSEQSLLIGPCVLHACSQWLEAHSGLRALVGPCVLHACSQWLEGARMNWIADKSVAVPVAAN
jgi:hypothetical protein